MVTHAGHGSVLKALAAGVPLVCMPMGRDRKDNTVRVLRLGAGMRVDKSADPDRIAAAVRRVLDEPAFADAARAMARTLANRGRHPSARGGPGSVNAGGAPAGAADGAITG